MRPVARLLCLASLLGCGGAPGSDAVGHQNRRARDGGAMSNLPTAYTLRLAAGRFHVTSESMAADREGLLYLIDDGPYRVDLSTGAVTKIESLNWAPFATRLMAATPGGGILSATDAAFGGEGGTSLGGLSRVREAGLEPIVTMPGSFFTPRGLAFDGEDRALIFEQMNSTGPPSGDVVSVDLATANVRVVAPTTVVVPSIGAIVTGVAGFAGDGAGTLFIADADDCVVCQRTPDGQTSLVAGKKGECALVDGTDGEARLGEPRGLAFDGDDSLYVLDGPRLRRISLSTGDVVTLVPAASSSQPEEGAPGGLFEPKSLALLPGGGVAIADSTLIFVATPSD